MPIPSHCAPCAEAARIVQRDLGTIEIDVTVREVGNLVAPIRSRSRFDLLDLRSDLPYPDPASFLGQILSDVPAGWISPRIATQVSDVMALNGGGRTPEAARLAGRLVQGKVLFAAYGTSEIPQFLAPTVGCRVFSPVGDGVDLAVLCPQDS